MIKAIIFDCFGVLTADQWHEFRTQLPSDQQAKASEFNQKYCRGEITKGEFLESVSRLTNSPKANIKLLIDNELDKNNRLLEYIKSIKPDYKIGLLSNVASNWIRDYFLTPEEQNLFDDMVLSFQVGLTKPDPEIYKIAATRLAVPTDQCLFVDDIERYCQAARDVGMKALRYSNFEQFALEITPLLSQV